VFSIRQILPLYPNIYLILLTSDYSFPDPANKKFQSLKKLPAWWINRRFEYWEDYRTGWIN